MFQLLFFLSIITISSHLLKTGETPLKTVYLEKFPSDFPICKQCLRGWKARKLVVSLLPAGSFYHSYDLWGQRCSAGSFSHVFSELTLSNCLSLNLAAVTTVKFERERNKVTNRRVTIVVTPSSVVGIWLRLSQLSHNNVPVWSWHHIPSTRFTNLRPAWRLKTKNNHAITVENLISFSKKKMCVFLSSGQISLHRFNISGTEPEYSGQTRSMPWLLTSEST